MLRLHKLCLIYALINLPAKECYILTIIQVLNKDIKTWEMLTRVKNMKRNKSSGRMLGQSYALSIRTSENLEKYRCKKMAQFRISQRNVN